MKVYEVKLFILGIYTEPEDMRTVTIKANSQEEAEQKAHDWYAPDGWGVYDSEEVTD